MTRYIWPTWSHCHVLVRRRGRVCDRAACIYRGAPGLPPPSWLEAPGLAQDIADAMLSIVGEEPPAVLVENHHKIAARLKEMGWTRTTGSGAAATTSAVPPTMTRTTKRDPSSDASQPVPLSDKDAPNYRIEAYHPLVPANPEAPLRDPGGWGRHRWKDASPIAARALAAPGARHKAALKGAGVVAMTGPLSEAELRYAYGLRTGEALREAAARVARWTYVPSNPSKMLDLARDSAELREALADELAADQLEAFPDALPVADPELDPTGDLR